MKELLRRLFQSPRISLELLAISLVANLLALASPIFVMLVLGRYVTHGIDATLITLSFWDAACHYHGISISPFAPASCARAECAGQYQSCHLG